MKATDIACSAQQHFRNHRQMKRFTTDHETGNSFQKQARALRSKFEATSM